MSEHTGPTAMGDAAVVIAGDGAVALPGAAARADFPPLTRELRPGVPLVYLDSAATALKPWPVIAAVREYYEVYPANVHRGLHELSERASAAYEDARAKVARFVGAADASELVFTHGTTESINLVAQGWACEVLKAGDEIVLTPLEHHANLVPWQMAARRTGASLRYAGLTPDGRLDLDSLDRLLSPRVKLVAVSGMSNVLGTVIPVAEVVARAHAVGAKVLIDGAQSVPHLRTDVSRLGIDFLAFSAHKLYGPTGVGALWARKGLLAEMEPMLGGGGMILRVDLTCSSWNEAPWKFEAGTPAVAEAIGFGAAVDYLARFDPADLAAHEHSLVIQAHEELGSIPGVRLLGPAPEFKGGILSFTTTEVHPHDLAQLLDREGVAIRAGHHCAMPLHQLLGVASSARASFSLYNTSDDVTALVEAVEHARRVFSR